MEWIVKKVSNKEYTVEHCTYPHFIVRFKRDELGGYDGTCIDDNEINECISSAPELMRRAGDELTKYLKNEKRK